MLIKRYTNKTMLSIYLLYQHMQASKSKIIGLGVHSCVRACVVFVCVYTPKWNVVHLIFEHSHFHTRKELDVGAHFFFFVI